MKKDIFRITSILVAILILFSCTKFEPEEIYYDSVLLQLSKNEMTILDTEITTVIDFVSKTRNVSSVVLLIGDKQILSTTASKNKVKVTLKRSDLGLKEIGDKVKLHVNATADGKVKKMYTYIHLIGAASIEAPTKKIMEDNKEIVVEDPVYELSDLVKNIVYKVKANPTTGFAVTAATKVGENATYTDLWTKEYNEADSVIGIKGSDYQLNDTVFFRLIAKRGNFVDTVFSPGIIIHPYLLNSSSFATAKIDVENIGYDLFSDTLCSTSTDSCKIAFVNDFSQLHQGFKTVNSTFVVKVPDDNEELLSCTNLPRLKTFFDSVSPLTLVNNVKVGDVYIIKIVKDSKEYYGKMTITKINTNREEDDDFIEFDYAVEEYNQNR